MEWAGHRMSGSNGRLRRPPTLTTRTLPLKGPLMADAHSIEYRDIPGFPGYRVGSDGSVWTSKVKGGNDRAAGKRGLWRLLRVHHNRAGYCLVNLDCDGRNHTRPIHRLVLELFVGPRPEGMEACHYPDADKNNNRLENLRWDTHGENAKDAYRDRPPVTEKICRRCKILKAVSEFYPDKRSTDGCKTECKNCHKQVVIATRDPEKRRRANREFMRKWRARNG
jgi:hypothetical protein